jgi:hypothetical protein
MMKRILMTLLLSGSLVANDLAIDPLATQRIVGLLDLSEDEYNDFANGKSKDLIVHCPGSTILPFNFTISGEFLEFVSDGYNMIKILKDCYVRVLENEEVLYSIDLKEWKNFSEFFTGRASFYARPENGILTTGFELDLRERNPRELQIEFPK